MSDKPGDKQEHRFAPECGSMEEFAEMCELVRKVSLATTNGEAVGHIASFRKKVREGAHKELRRQSMPRFRGETTIISEHHTNEVHKHYERLIEKYAGADFSNTNTEAGCIWNDAVNLAEGIAKERALAQSAVTDGDVHQGPFGYEWIGGRWRIKDANDNALCHCHSEGNAQEVVRRLNASVGPAGRAPDYYLDPKDREVYVCLESALEHGCLQSELIPLYAHPSPTAQDVK